MPEISKVQLPSGGIYDIKDATARQMISGGVSFIIAWDGNSTPVPGNIPLGVVVTYNNVEYVGTLSADDQSVQAGAFYLIKSSTITSEGKNDSYDEYVPVGTTGSKTWEKIGDTQVDLSDVVTEVTLNKQTDVVLGESTTFALTSGSVTHGSLSGHTTNVVTGYSNPSTDTFVKSVSAETNKKLVTATVPNVTSNANVTIPNVTGNTSVTIPNVTSAGSASTWSFTMGSGDNSETLIISGSNSVAPTLGTALTATNTTLGSDLSASKVTLGTAITVATGETSTTGTGDAIVTGVTIGSSASAITSLGDASTIAAVTSMPTSTVGTGITVGTNDKVTTLTSSTSLDVTKGN